MDPVWVFGPFVGVKTFVVDADDAVSYAHLEPGAAAVIETTMRLLIDEEISPGQETTSP